MIIKKCLLIFTASFYLQLATKVWTLPLHGNLKLMGLKAEDVHRESKVKRIKRSAPSMSIFIYTRHTNRYVRVTANKINALASSSNDKYAELLLTVLPTGEVSLKGKESRKFICMNHKGYVVLKTVFKKPECMFHHIIHASGYEIFRSVYNPKWHLGFKQNGDVKQGHKTQHHHHAAWMFMKYKKNAV